MTLIIFVRHAESLANVELHKEKSLPIHEKSTHDEMNKKIANAGNDPELSELGLKQAQNVAMYLKTKLNNQPCKIITSAYKRAIQTSEPLKSMCENLVEYTINSSVNEYTHPNKKLSEDDIANGIKNHDNWEEFIDSIFEFISEIELKIQADKDDKPIVIFGHSIYLSVMTTYIGSAKTFIPDKTDLVFRIPNCSITTFNYDKNSPLVSRWQIHNVASVKHLPDELLSGHESQF